MHEASTHPILAAGLTQKQVTSSVVCRFCGSPQIYRLYREGFLQNRIYPFFGYYPWRCKDCSSPMMLRKRRKLKQRVRTESA